MTPLEEYGAAISARWIEGIKSNLGNGGGWLRRLRDEMENARLEVQAHTSAAHADWFCSLPWYRQWWALVTGR